MVLSMKRLTCLMTCSLRNCFIILYFDGLLPIFSQNTIEKIIEALFSLRILTIILKIIFEKFSTTVQISI